MTQLAPRLAVTHGLDAACTRGVMRSVRTYEITYYIYLRAYDTFGATPEAAAHAGYSAGEYAVKSAIALCPWHR